MMALKSLAGPAIMAALSRHGRHNVGGAQLLENVATLSHYTMPVETHAHVAERAALRACMKALLLRVPMYALNKATESTCVTSWNFAT